jgi:hypothetical protein
VQVRAGAKAPALLFPGVNLGGHAVEDETDVPTRLHVELVDRTGVPAGAPLGLARDEPWKATSNDGKEEIGGARGSATPAGP